MPNRLSERRRETTKLSYDWGNIAFQWRFCIVLVVYTLGARSFVYLLFSLTPTLWSPRESLYWLLQPLIFESGGFIDYNLAAAWLEKDASGRCLTWKEKMDAISTSLEDVSGWYGPGAYLGWLLTAYVTAVPCNWHSKCSEYNAESRRLDGETLGTLIYPLVAVFDIIIRLIRCQIDPGMSAAVFVVISSLVIIGPVTRLSWQYDGHGETALEYSPRSLRHWVWVTMRFTCHTIVCATFSEPYGYTKLVGTVYALLFVVLLYSRISATALSEKYPYFYRHTYRSPGERVIAFGVVQVVFMVILLSMHYSIWPATGTKIWELDQVAGFSVTVAMLCYPRLNKLGYLKLLERPKRELPSSLVEKTSDHPQD
ncbi:hypothetical protein IFM5058_10266 [Aspergillus udagawae]|nr:hypothetical protein IFM5058_10266 [Aspergillus udagawae]